MKVINRTFEDQTMLEFNNLIYELQHIYGDKASYLHSGIDAAAERIAKVKVRLNEMDGLIAAHELSPDSPIIGQRHYLTNWLMDLDALLILAVWRINGTTEKSDARRTQAVILHQDG